MRSVIHNRAGRQLIWGVVAVAAAAVCIGSIPAGWSGLVKRCPHSSTCSGLNASAVHTLSTHHLSVTSVALFSVAVLGAVWVVWYGIATLLAWRKPEDPGVMVCAFFLAVFPVALSGILLWPSFPGVGALIAIPFFALFLFCLLFPDGHFRPRWTRWLVPAGVVSSALVGVPSLTGIAIMPMFLLLLIGVGVQVYRFRSTSSWTERQQSKWAVLGLVVSTVGLILMIMSFSLPGNVNGSLYDSLGTSAVAIIPTAIPVSIAIAVLKSRLWDIDRVISRALVYTTLTAILAGVYIGSVIGLQALFHQVVGKAPTLAIVISTLAIAALFGPLRRRIQIVIDRRFYRSRYDAARTLEKFNAKLRDQVDLPHLSEDLTSVIRQTFHPEHVSIWLRQS